MIDQDVKSRSHNQCIVNKKHFPGTFSQRNTFGISVYIHEARGTSRNCRPVHRVDAISERRANAQDKCSSVEAALHPTAAESVEIYYPIYVAIEAGVAWK